MKTKNLKPGLTLLCLSLLAGCTGGPPLPVPPVITLGCNRVTACSLPPSNPQSNEDLLKDIRAIELAWANCAAQVDMIIQCQEQPHE
ncbi:Rz1-like lysis system protein LysC [Oceanisphaera sp. KMM 10153]|uniref:Rz1-like lysis system protein LysC n=1 Tax=Oceanisphaera submarina TaxID=3390193 RepID=UPI0039755B36